MFCILEPLIFHQVIRIISYIDRIDVCSYIFLSIDFSVMSARQERGEAHAHIALLELIC